MIKLVQYKSTVRNGGKLYYVYKDHLSYTEAKDVSLRILPNDVIIFDFYGVEITNDSVFISEQTACRELIRRLKKKHGIKK